MTINILQADGTVFISASTAAVLIRKGCSPVMSGPHPEKMTAPVPLTAQYHQDETGFWVNIRRQSRRGALGVTVVRLRRTGMIMTTCFEDNPIYNYLFIIQSWHTLC